MISNIVVLLFLSRLFKKSVILDHIIITENTCWSIDCNPKHQKLVPERLHHLNSHAHSEYFRTKYNGIKCHLLLTIPIDWYLITTSLSQYDCTEYSFTLPSLYPKFQYYHMVESFIGNVRHNKLLKSLVKVFLFILLELVGDYKRENRFK